MIDPANDPTTMAQLAAQALAERTGVGAHDVAIQLGSGWAPAVDALGTPTAVIPMAELPGFLTPRAAGHEGQLLSIPVGPHRVLALIGRVHAYEGHDLRDVVHPVRTAIAAGPAPSCSPTPRADCAPTWPSVSRC